MINDLCESSQLRCRIHIDDLPATIMVPSHIRHNLCMVVKEAINNSLKHAQANEIKLNVAYKQPDLTVTIQDDGKGFTPGSPDGGHGLFNMKNRLEEIGGAFEIASQIDSGTTITLRLQIHAGSH